MSMKKIIPATMLTLFVIGGTAHSAYATISADGQSGNTETTIGFSEENHVVDPTEGLIGLTSIPSNFNFGKSNQVSSQVQSIAVTNSGAQYVTATDLRAQKTGWSITAQASEMVNVMDTTDKISNATLQISGDAMTQTNGAWNSTNDVAVNTLHLNAGGDSTTFVSTTAADTSSLPGQEVGARLRNVQLNLAANQGTAEQQYAGTVTWNLESVPNPS
ncbi:WxL domain surface cell wall-binding [Enterococcus casseliflavus]|uniref:WxL domain-containing protein n=1 Tax=Enterococcus casseliflavus TaxID=37734 RepID=UPI0008E3C57D|nr:WxL domain-containing protein [Enterococcus casseliflavus]SFE58111.1 WxL domain surface cell wall-binding [Enterococcus casseliflavus]